MTPTEFKDAGRRVFGPKWKTPLARELGCTPVTIWRYASGLTAIPWLVERRLRELEAENADPTTMARGGKPNTAASYVTALCGVDVEPYNCPTPLIAWEA